MIDLEEKRGITIPTFAGRDKYNRRIWLICYKKDNVWKRKTFTDYNAAYSFYIDFIKQLRLSLGGPYLR